jgi:hypothetical protein
MTTLAEIKKMVNRCLVSDCQPDSGSDQPTATDKPLGSSSTEANSTALAAARLRAKRLKEG